MRSFFNYSITKAAMIGVLVIAAIFGVSNVWAQDNNPTGPQGSSGNAVSGSTATTDLNYDVFMKLDTIKGDSRAKNYPDWIVLTGVQFDASQVTSTGGSSGAGSGKPKMNEFVVKKGLDSSSIPIFQNMLTGKRLKECTIVFVSRGQTPTPILTIKLSNVMISDYNFNNILESFQLNFTKIQSTYTGGKSPITGGFDFLQNKTF